MRCEGTSQVARCFGVIIGNHQVAGLARVQRSDIVHLKSCDSSYDIHLKSCDSSYDQRPGKKVRGLSWGFCEAAKGRRGEEGDRNGERNQNFLKSDPFTTSSSSRVTLLSFSDPLFFAPLHLCTFAFNPAVLCSLATWRLFQAADDLAALTRGDRLIDPQIDRIGDHPGRAVGKDDMDPRSVLAREILEVPHFAIWGMVCDP